MKFSNVITTLHYVFMAGINLLCMFLLDYHYLPYTIIMSVLIMFGWILNKDCFMLEYEHFIECSYEGIEDKCTLLDKSDHRLQLHIDLWNRGWIILMIGISLSFIRYRYQYNFFSISSSNVLTTILLISFFTSINLLFLLLFIPAINYYKTYKNKKQLFIYMTYFLMSIAFTLNYALKG